MKKPLYISAVLLCLVMICAACSLSCRQDQPTAPDANETQPAGTEPNLVGSNLAGPDTAAKAPLGADGTEVAVTVNRTNITEAQIDAKMEFFLEKMRAQGRQLSPQSVQQYKKQNRLKVLEGLVIEHLLEEKVTAAGIVVTEDEVTERIKQMAALQKPPLSVEDLKAVMEAHGQSLDELKGRLRKDLAHMKLIAGQSPPEINVTEADAKKYYEENKKKFEMPEQVRASHILIKPDTTDPNVDPNGAKAVAKAQAQDLLKQIKDGADFAELATEHSACRSAERGGDLGYRPRGQWAPPFEEAAFKLEVDQISDVVETGYGYHIIKLTDHKEAEVRTFEQAKDYIMERLARESQNERARRYVESLKTEAKIVYPPGKEPWANRRF